MKARQGIARAADHWYWPSLALTIGLGRLFYLRPGVLPLGSDSPAVGEIKNPLALLYEALPLWRPDAAFHHGLFPASAPVDMMLVSVIIPVHNRPRAVRRAVLSVLAQRGVQVEVVVVDDGSTDATPTVLKMLRDRRVTVIRQKNRGVSAARNRGLRDAQGEMLALLDSDDIWLPQKMARHLHYHRQGNWRVSQTDEIWIRDGRRVNPEKIHAKREGFFFEAALSMCLVSPSCVAFDRSFWEEIGPFDESLAACEDYDLWLRTLIRYPVGLCPEKLVVKTGGHPDQLSRKIIGLDLYRLQALLKLLQSGVLDNERLVQTKKVLRAKAMIYIRGCLKRDRPEEAMWIKEWLKKWLRE